MTDNEHIVGLAKAPGGSGPGSPYDPAPLQALIRTALQDAGLGRVNPRAPLADIIQRGMTVLLKPNWVLHRNEGGGPMDCMVTHSAFIEAALAEVLLAKPSRVIIGDSPIQLCRFDQLIPEAWRERLRLRSSAPVEIVDFRRHVSKSENLQDGVDEEVRSLDHYLLFDLAQDSLLEAISGRAGMFRITNYHPDGLANTHRAGRHQFLLCREAFEADVIINLPKLKTHRKTGITGALKNLVGLNGSKNYLPHHRVGGTVLGGDCYPGLAPVKRLAEFCLDQANRRLNTSGYPIWHRRAYQVLEWHQRRFGDREMEGSWYGNDTTWRMVLDINRLLLHGRVDGTLSEAPLRRVYSLTDGLIAGQGDGPLCPEPLDLGVVTFATSSPFAELVHTALLGFDYERLSLVREAFGRFRYPLTERAPSDCVVRANGAEMTCAEAARRFGVNARPPAGWAGHVERAATVPADA